MCDIHALADVLSEVPALKVDTAPHGVAVSNGDHRVVLTLTGEGDMVWFVQCLDGEGFPLPVGDVHGHGETSHAVDSVEGRGSVEYAIPVLGIAVDTEVLSMARQALSYA